MDLDLTKLEECHNNVKSALDGLKRAYEDESDIAFFGISMLVYVLAQNYINEAYNTVVTMIQEKNKDKDCIQKVEK